MNVTKQVRRLGMNVMRLLQKNLSFSIPAAMILGLLFGYYNDPSFLKNLIIPITFMMVYPMMATLNVGAVFSGKDARLQVTTQLINFLVMPLVAFGIGWLFFTGQEPKYGLWAVGLFLLGVLPASGMTISWTGFARGNKEAATKMLVFGLIIGALAAPVYTKVFMGATIEVNMPHMFQQIALFVFVPLVVGLGTQYALRWKYGLAAWNKRIKEYFPPFSALGVNLIAFTAMSLKAKNIVQNPDDILIILLPLLVFYLVTYGTLTVLGRVLFSRGDAIAMVFGVVMRDLSIALAVAMTAFGKQGYDIALLISLAYVIQIQSAAMYVRFAPGLFGHAPEETAGDSMSEGVFALRHDHTIMDAVKLLDEEHIHTVAVHSGDDTIVGVVTSRMVVNLLAAGVSLDTELAGVELQPVITLDSRSPIHQVLENMKRNHTYKVVVTDAGGKPKGMLTESDIMHLAATGN
jgi:arsenite transporter